MKEDKLDQEIAASLKKKLVEASVPYELGAWERFQKRRASQRRKRIAYWVSGVAASLLLVAVGMNGVDFAGFKTIDSAEKQLADRTQNLPESNGGEFSNVDPESGKETVEGIIEQESGEAGSNGEKIPDSIDSPQRFANQSPTKIEVVVSESNEKTVDTEQSISNSDEANKTINQSKQNLALVQPPFSAYEVDAMKSSIVQSSDESLPLIKVEEPNVPSGQIGKEKYVAESDFPEIEKDKASVGIGMGLSPGFGAIQNDNQVATAQTIGLGMLVDIKLPGRVTLGSGLGLNYLNQNAKEETMVMSLGNTYPQTEKVEVRQMQVEVPVFVKYPLTKNNSITLQAGFSNYYALNESASQENITERQSAVYSSDALGSTSVSFRQEAVSESTTLASEGGKFYPFATLNFGVNLRVLETKGANYVVMPFYNYQLKQVSGYGDTYGLFGASFKINFGGK